MGGNNRHVTPVASRLVHVGFHFPHLQHESPRDMCQCDSLYQFKTPIQTSLLVLNFDSHIMLSLDLTFFLIYIYLLIYILSYFIILLLCFYIILFLNDNLIEQFFYNLEFYCNSIFKQGNLDLWRPWYILMPVYLGHRPRNTTVVCPWPASPSLSWCIPSLLFLFLYRFARCFVAYLFASSPRGSMWWVVVSGGFLHFLFVSFSMCSLFRPFPECPLCLSTSGVGFCTGICWWRSVFFLVSSVYLAMSLIHRVKLPWHSNWIFSRC